ncbi:hypothetical protein TRVA0_002S01134 [Trichomonascus vanleenenianus]|uniref:glycoside hydrolase family 27 protein n=1 Tax=Trichomonascus vanleenenianus TaxID=2268995 RepID=UPI003ECA9929
MRVLQWLSMAAVALAAATPQMGWNNWNTFGCMVSEELLTSTANVIVDLGLKDLGYNYIILDDCWSEKKRDRKGRLQPNSTRFPNGMKHVANHLHSKGLLFGMYSCAGTKTCSGFPGSLNHEKTDAKSFASWEVDYLKYDNCYNDGQSGSPEVSFLRYKKMADALRVAGRDIFYSLCNWGQDASFAWGFNISNSWRITGDIGPHFNSPSTKCPCSEFDYYRCGGCHSPGSNCSVMNILSKAALVAQFSSPGYGTNDHGGWNDLDVLEVGNAPFTDGENRIHFSMWAALKSSMVLGNDVRSMLPQDFSVITNPAVLAISQDPLGISARRVWRQFVSDTGPNQLAEISLWSGPLAGGDQVVALLNAAASPQVMEAALFDIFYAATYSPEIDTNITKTWDVYDLWANQITEDQAAEVLNGDSPPSKYLYNATKQSYAAGLDNNDELLLGKKIGQIDPNGSLTINISGHDIALLRLRESQGSQENQGSNAVPSGAIHVTNVFRCQEIPTPT